MEILGYPQGQDAGNVQIWNNAAFDDDESAVRTSWMRPEVMEMRESKENQSPNFLKSPVLDECPVPGKPPAKPLKLLFKQGHLDLPPPPPPEKDKIDSEIEGIEKEIARLSERLEALRLQKTTRSLSNGDFTERKILKTPKKIEELPPSGQSRRRGLSLGPAEISGAARFRPMETPQSRRKSCFWKLPGIQEEEKGRKGQGKKPMSVKNPRSMSLSPKSRASRMADPRLGIATVGAKKPAKKEEAQSLQPRRLFGEKPISGQKPVKNARIVASRYSQIPARAPGNISPTTDRRKRSLPENDRKENGRKSRAAPENGTRRRWEVPDETPGLEDVGEALPKIRTGRCVNESPRDSGCAKRVADLVGKRSFFAGDDGEVVTSISQVLGFEEDE